MVGLLVSLMVMSPADAATPGQGFNLIRQPSGLGYSAYTIRFFPAAEANSTLKAMVHEATDNMAGVVGGLSFNYGPTIYSASNLQPDEISVEIVTSGYCNGVPYGSWGGCTATEAYPDGMQMRARIQIPADHLPGGGSAMDTPHLRSAVKHELGHAAGLDHYSPAPLQVMYPRIDVPSPAENYQAGDIDGLNYLADHGFRNPVLVNPTLSLEPLTLSTNTAGKLWIKGYAFDPQQSARPALALRVNGIVVSPVEWAYAPAGHASVGFWYQIDLPPKDASVCVTAINVGPGTDTTSCPTFTQTMKPSPKASAIVMPGGTTARAFWNSGGNLWTGTESSSQPWPNGPFQPLALGIVGTPSSVTAADSKQWVFWRGVNNDLWGGYIAPDGSWNTFWPARSGVMGSPTVVANGNVIDVYYEGSNSQLWHVWTTNNSTWSAGAQVAGSVAGTPAVTATQAGVMNVFWRRTDNSLGQRAVRFDANYVFTNGIEFTLDGSIVGDPSAASLGTDAHVFYTSSSYAVVHKWWNPDLGWVGEVRSLGVASAPAVSHAGAAGLYVFWTSTLGQNIGQYYQVATGSWAFVSGPTSTGVESAPVVTRGNASGKTMVLWTGGTSLWGKNFLNGTPNGSYLVATSCC